MKAKVGKKLIKQMVMLGFTLVVLVSTIFAWFVKGKIDYDVTFSSGKISYTLTGKIKTLIVPGENIVTENITITNNSTIRHSLRILVELKFKGEVIAFDDEIIETSDLNLTSFSFNEEDGYYYLDVLDYQNQPHFPTILSELVLDGYHMQEHDQSLTIYLKLEVRQYDHLEWEDLGELLID